MHATARGFETTRGGVFQHFGYITFGLMLLFGLVVVRQADVHRLPLFAWIGEPGPGP